MKRYFDLPEKRLVATLEIYKGSKEETASVEQIKTAMKWNCKVEEVNKAKHDILKNEYSRQGEKGMELFELQGKVEDIIDLARQELSIEEYDEFIEAVKMIIGE